MSAYTDDIRTAWKYPLCKNENNQNVIFFSLHNSERKNSKFLKIAQSGMTKFKLWSKHMKNKTKHIHINLAIE